MRKQLEVFSMLNRPVKKWRVGAVEAAVWENKKSINGGEISYRTVTLSRSYKKKEENIWRSEVINNLRRGDIEKLQAILRQVQEYLYFDVQQEKEDEGGE